MEVHTADMYFPALLPVAVSRVTSPDGLRVHGFNKQSVIPPDPDVIKAISNHGCQKKTTLQCCLVEDSTVSDTEFVVGYVSEEEDDDQSTGDPFAHTSAGASSTDLPSTSSDPSSTNTTKVILLLEQQIIKQAVTFKHKTNNDDIKYLSSSYSLVPIHTMLEERLTSIYTATISGNIESDSPNGPIFNDFVTNAYSFLTDNLPTILNHEHQLDQKYHHYIHQMFIDMMNNYTKREAELLGKETVAKKYSASTEIDPSDAGRGTIRRVGGRTLYLMTKEMTRRLSFIKPTDVLGDKWNLYKAVKECLFSMKASLHDVLNGLYPETIRETTRRSRTGGGLTHITDGTFELFIEIEKERAKLQTISNGLLQGADVVKNTYLSLLMNQHLKDTLYENLPTGLTENTEAIQMLWELLLAKYVPVCNNTYRKQLHLALDKSRVVAHRKRIEATSETSTSKRLKRTASKKVCLKLILNRSTCILLKLISQIKKWNSSLIGVKLLTSSVVTGGGCFAVNNLGNVINETHKGLTHGVKKSKQC